jgi:hypothetical protein
VLLCLNISLECRNSLVYQNVPTCSCNSGAKVLNCHENGLLIMGLTYNNRLHSVVYL